MSSNIQIREGTSTSVLVCAIFLIVTQLIATTHCQVSDGDEQFVFQHQDIGRISGLSSGSSQVAPQTTIISRQQQQPPVFNGEQQPLTSPLPPAVAQVIERAHTTQQFGSGVGHSRAAQRISHTGSQRKPNRITLVPRREPLPAGGSHPISQAQPSGLVPAQLPAPPQQAGGAQFQPAATSATHLVDELSQPTFAPIATPVHQHQHHHQQVAAAAAAVAGPALSSFRATGASVSDRHSALIARVAAERAAVAQAAAPSLISSIAQRDPSFSSPAEALSSQRTVAVVATHRQPAFPSFTNQLDQAQPLAPLNQVGHLAAAPSQPASFVNQPEEPLVAPTYEQVLSQGCPHKGVFSWENRDNCDRYYMCTNGTFTEEACPNGLAYSQQGAVYQHCAYNWNVNCGAKKTAEPIASPGCPWQFGIFPIVQAGRCSIDYFVCEWGVPDTKRCSPDGLFYDDRIKGCQWADQLGCKSEALLNFKCPPEDEDNQFWPFPRYYHSTKDVIVCVNEQPRLVHCTEQQIVDPGSLACMEINKKKQKF